jgi:hypothetical protein
MTKTFYYETSSEQRFLPADTAPTYYYAFWSTSDQNVYPSKTRKPPQLAYSANRVWMLDHKTGNVTWVKNRDFGIMAAVDPQEFFMVQLKAAPCAVQE